MSAKERQQAIIAHLIQTSPIRLKIDKVFQVGSERPDNHIYSLGCECGDWVPINLEQDKNAERKVGR